MILFKFTAKRNFLSRHLNVSQVWTQSDRTEHTDSMCSRTHAIESAYLWFGQSAVPTHQTLEPVV